MTDYITGAEWLAKYGSPNNQQGNNNRPAEAKEE